MIRGSLNLNIKTFPDCSRLENSTNKEPRVLDHKNKIVCTQLNNDNVGVGDRDIQN